MSLYWLHISTENVDGRKAYGPFENPEVMARFRAIYADDEDESGYRRSVDELPMLPGTQEYDEHESDVWIPIQADNLFLLDGFPTFAVREQEAFVVVNDEVRVDPVLSE